MRCKYCGNKVKASDEVCRGCSATVPVVNHAAGWALAFAAAGLAFCIFPVLNLPFFLAAFIFMITGFILAGARGGKGKIPSILSLIFIVLGLVLTIFISSVYRAQYDVILESAQSMLDQPVQKETAQRLLDIMTMNFFRTLS